MNPGYSTFLLNHLLQSTVFAIAAALLAYALRKNRAEVRFRIWLAASLKFAIPFAWIESAGRLLKPPPSAMPAASVYHAAQRFEQTFNVPAIPIQSMAFDVHATLPLGTIALLVWGVGAAIVLFRWGSAWLRMRRIARSATRAAVAFSVPVRLSDEPVEPGVFGIFRPVLLLPASFAGIFRSGELDAILAHELCHIRRRDNLTAAFHASVQALFWFHPAVWLIGSKLLEERELACDQEVLRAGNSPESYAEGILKVCRLCLEPVPACVSGVAGSHLRQRIEGILSNSVSERLNRGRKFLIGMATVVALVSPLLVGVLQTQHASAQPTGAKPLEFEVATVKPSSSDSNRFMFRVPGGNLQIRNMTLKKMIEMAYNVRDSQIIGGPGWISSNGFDIDAKVGDRAPVDPRSMTAAQGEIFQKQIQERLRSLLKSRFRLAVHDEQKEMPVYALLVSKSGHKLKTAADANGQSGKGRPPVDDSGIRVQRGALEGVSAPIKNLTDALAGTVGRPVVDKTGLTGRYDWKLEWTPDQSGPSSPMPGSDKLVPPTPTDISGPSIFTAIQDQLGLRLEPQKATTRTIVIRERLQTYGELNVNSTDTAFLLNHLLQSTIFTAAATMLAYALRKNPAEVRFRIWLAASLKFVIPFAWIANAGRLFTPSLSAVPTTPVFHAAQQLEQTFTVFSIPSQSISPGDNATLPLGTVALLVWAIGAAIVLFRWGAAWLRMQRIARSSTQVTVKFPAPVRVSDEPIEPGVFGIMWPVLLLPAKFADILPSGQLDAILAHELCHIRRRDNLTAMLHAAVQALFWFHPAVWLIGSKLLEERELACDQEVLLAGKSPESYAEGILKVCRLCLEPMPACVSGVAGSHLRQRIEAILSNDTSRCLSRARKLAIGTAATVVLASPLLVGVLQTQRASAQQAGAKPLEFEVASVKPSSSDPHRVSFMIQPGGKLQIQNMTLKKMIEMAYDVRDSQIIGGPGWTASDPFDVEAKIGEPSAGALRDLTAGQREIFQKQLQERLRSLLKDRFRLRVHEEQRDMPVYALVVAKGGHKLKPAADPNGMAGMRAQRGSIEGSSAALRNVTDAIAGYVGKPVIDKTDLTGRYDWKLEWTPEQSGPSSPMPGSDKLITPAPSDISGPSIFSALQEQLGLRLEPQKAPALTIVVESASKPEGN